MLALYAAVFGYYYAALPCYINASEKSTGSFSGAVLHESSKGCTYYLGSIPVKNVEVMKRERPELIPCGTPFGIKCTTDGVMVISVEDKSPAQKAGMKAGDVIKNVNGCDVYSNDELAQAVQTSSGITNIILERKNGEIALEISPRFNGEEFKIGAWVRDSAAGIGTLTFVDPQTSRFGGLGHSISDVTTGESVPLKSGEITSAEICGIVKGENGSAGELCGTITPNSDIGILQCNTPSGIFGTLDIPANAEPVPMAYRQEVTTGDATILTTIDGEVPKEYSIRIDRINLLDLNGSKAMVISITDKELLEKTGGIVRGMSGSPILQNGRIVGAVTHVLLNDPTRGYGIFAETMYDEMTNNNSTDINSCV